MSQSTKTCACCRETKPLEDFYRRSAAADGRQGYCKVCQLARNSDWHRSNRPRRVELARKWQRENPEKDRAEKAVQSAVRAGRLVKPACCEDCGERVEASRLLHGHHEDYSRPLDVEWLCSRCHKARHHGLATALAAAETGATA